MKNALKRAEQNPSIIFLALAILIGGYIRLSGVLKADFPLNDGGLFYTMTQDLIANGFRIPEFTTYNQLNIPFAYPPLGFYLAGILNQFLGWDLLDIFRILPAVFTVLTIPAFYLLAKELIHNDFQVGLATLAFTFLPPSFDWLIMGGGVTRAPAFLFALLSLFFYHRLYTHGGTWNVLLSGIVSALTVLTHPETALHTAASALVFFLFLGRNRAGIVKSLLVALLTLGLTSPWWINVLGHHGFSPFLAAGKTGWHGYEAVINLLLFDFTSEYNLKTIGVLALVGVFIKLAKRDLLLPVWFLVVFISEPRSAPLYLTLLIALLAAFTLEEILRKMDSIEKKIDENRNLPQVSSGKISKLFLALLVGQWIFSAYSGMLLSFNFASLYESDYSAFLWVKAETPINSRFLLLTGTPPLSDAVSEWFPALTGRSSVATVQGYEWVLDKDFNKTLKNSLSLQYCRDQGLICIKNWSKDHEKEYDYLYIRKYISRDGGPPEIMESAILELLEINDTYSLIYDTDGVAIFQK